MSLVKVGFAGTSAVTPAGNTTVPSTIPKATTARFFIVMQTPVRSGTEAVCPTIRGYASLGLLRQAVNNPDAVEQRRRLCLELPNLEHFPGFREAMMVPCDLVVLFLQLLGTVGRLAGPGGARSAGAESVLVKRQLLVVNRSGDHASR